MGKFIKNVLIFAAGLATGYAVSYKVLNKKYDQEFQEYKDHYDNLKDEEPDEIVDEEIEDEYEEIKENIEEKVNEERTEKDASYKTVLDQCHYSPASNDYTSYGNDNKEKSEIEQKFDNFDDDNEKPYVVEPDMLGFLEDSSVEYLTMYSDGIIASDTSQIPWSDDDIETFLGRDNLRKIGKYAEDIVHIYYPPSNTYYEVTLVYEDYE